MRCDRIIGQAAAAAARTKPQWAAKWTQRTNESNNDIACSLAALSLSRSLAGSHTQVRDTDTERNDNNSPLFLLQTVNPFFLSLSLYLLNTHFQFVRLNHSLPAHQRALLVTVCSLLLSHSNETPDESNTIDLPESVFFFFFFLSLVFYVSYPFASSYAKLSLVRSQVHKRNQLRAIRMTSTQTYTHKKATHVCKPLLLLMLLLQQV